MLKIQKDIHRYVYVDSQNLKANTGYKYTHTHTHTLNIQDICSLFLKITLKEIKRKSSHYYNHSYLWTWERYHVSTELWHLSKKLNHVSNAKVDWVGVYLFYEVCTDTVPMYLLYIAFLILLAD